MVVEVDDRWWWQLRLDGGGKGNIGQRWRTTETAAGVGAMAAAMAANNGGGSDY